MIDAVRKLALTFFALDSNTIGSGQFDTITKNFESTTVTANFGLKNLFFFIAQKIGVR